MATYFNAYSYTTQTVWGLSVRHVRAVTFKPVNSFRDLVYVEIDIGLCIRLHEAERKSANVLVEISKKQTI